MKLMAKKYKPFSTGSQYDDWNGRNCCSCKKGFKRAKYHCNLEPKLDAAYCGDGTITEETARAIGYIGNEEGYIWEYPGWARR